MQELWRSKCGAVRAKRKKEKGGKNVFESGMKMVLRIGGDSDQGGEKLFEVEWNQLIAEDWREDVKI